MDHNAAQFGAAAELGEDLAGIEQMVGIEGALHAHLLVQVDLGELHAHQVALLDSDAMLAGQHAADAHAEPQDIGAEFLGAMQLVGIVGVEQDQRMEIAVTGMEDVDDPQTMLLRHLAHLGQHLDQAAARHRAIEAHIVGRYLADGGERRLAAGPEQHPLLLVVADADRRGAAAPGDLGDALDQVIDLDRWPVEFDDQQSLGVERIARTDIGLGAPGRVLVHHLHAAGDDAGGDDGGDAIGSAGFGRETQEHRACRRRLAQQPHRHFCDDTQQALGAGHDAQKIVALGVEMLASEANHFAGHQHHLDAQQVVGGEAVLQAMHAARILRDVAADRAGDLRAGIGRVIKALMLDRLGDAEVGDAGLHAGAAVGVVDLEHTVELAKAQQDGIAHRHRAARERRAGAARHDLDLIVLAVAQDRRDLCHRLGQHHDQRHLAIGRERIALVGAHALQVVDHALAWDDGTQGSDDLGPAGENGGIERRHLHASLIRQIKKRRKPRAPPP